MKEVGSQFYLEESYDGVVLGACKLDHGLLLVDSPLRFSDQALWRENIRSLGVGKEQITLMLDTHIDSAPRAEPTGELGVPTVPVAAVSCAVYAPCMQQRLDELPSICQYRSARYRACMQHTPI